MKPRPLILIVDDDAASRSLGSCGLPPYSIGQRPRLPRPVSANDAKVSPLGAWRSRTSSTKASHTVMWRSTCHVPPTGWPRRSPGAAANSAWTCRTGARRAAADNRTARTRTPARRDVKPPTSRPRAMPHRTGVIVAMLPAASVSAAWERRAAYWALAHSPSGTYVPPGRPVPANAGNAAAPHWPAALASRVRRGSS